MARPRSHSRDTLECPGTSGEPAMFEEARGKGELVQSDDGGDDVVRAEQHMDACRPASRPSSNLLEVGLQAEA